MNPLEILVLGPAAMPAARRLREAASGSRIHALRSRIGSAGADCDLLYDHFGEHLRGLYAGTTPIVALCAAGIIIRALAPRLVDEDKQNGPAVLALAPDGRAAVPLLGGLQGVNTLARDIARHMEGHAAITTSGELRFGTCLLQPPPGYVLADIERGKQLVSGLLAGDEVSVHGAAPWLDATALPRSPSAQRHIHVSARRDTVADDELRIYPRSVALAIRDGLAGAEELERTLRQALERAALAPQALAVLLMPGHGRGQQAAEDAAAALGAELRLLDSDDASPAAMLQLSLPPGTLVEPMGADLAVALAEAPLQPDAPGRPRGRLSVIGLGPGDARWMVPAARTALDQATDIMGYATYVEMAGPLRPGQRSHPTDNREELQRAAHAFELAARGHRVAMVSSGDPGIFAMAAATLEALEASGRPDWHEVGLEILPGISAAMATAAVAGAPLGHDFCMLSLSDNLKPWQVIERRLQLAAEADLVMAFYNPISRHRPWQLARALDIVRQYRTPETPVLLGRNIARPGGRLQRLSLQALQPEQVDMRTLVIIGSSTTRGFARSAGGEWVYTPRSYPFGSEN